MKKKSKFYDYEDNDLDEQQDSFNCAKDDEDDEDDEDEISLEKEEEIIKNLDDDLVKYFGDAKIITNKKINNNLKKNKKKDFIIGQKVIINGICGKIIFGPYEINNKLMCEIELENGNIISEDVSKL